MAKLMPMKRKMILCSSRSIKIYYRRKRNVIRPSETKKGPSRKNINIWGMAFWSLRKHSMTKLVRNLKKTKQGTMTINLKEMLMTTSSPSSKNEDWIQLSLWVLWKWPWRSRPMWWKRWRKGSSPGPRSFRNDYKSSKMSWRCSKNSIRRSSRRRTRNNWARSNLRSVS